MNVHRIAAATRAFRAEDLSGAGAAVTGGRWNPVGVPALYCAGGVALAYLETLVHLPFAGPPPASRFLIAVEIPTAVWARRANARRLPGFPADWNARPAPREAALFGGRWLARGAEALLVVPSVVVPAEWNVVVNPRHADAARLRLANRGSVEYDPRFFR